MRNIALIVLASLCMFSAEAQAEDKASLRLNWLIYGFHTPFYLGVERGIYSRHGIDLTIGEGQGSGRTVLAIAAGSDTFGLADGASIIAGAAKGAPVQAIMGIMNQSPYAIIVRKDSGITTLQGLAGQTVAATTGEAGLAILPAVLAKNGMAPDAINFLRIDGSSKLVAILENRAVGIVGGIETQALILEARGMPVTSLAYAELGVNTVGPAILTSRDTIAQNPDLVRRFVLATRESFEAAIEDPEAAIQAGIKVKPDMDHDLNLAQLKAALALLKSPRGKDQPVGWMSDADWADTLAIAKEYQDLQTDEPATAFYNKSFLPE